MASIGTARKAGAVRGRLIDAAYDLFAEHGVNQVGIDTILAQSGCAKASLYNNFNSKVELAVAFLDRREAVWTRGWLEHEVHRLARTPKGRLLAIFDVFHAWFQRRDFEGCSFINVMLESDAGSPVRQAAAIHLGRIRAILRELAEGARLADSERFAQTWHMLMKGCIVSACEGNRNAARQAKRAARYVLEAWPQRRVRPTR
ncbi:MAG TPA: TetR/AcrR family transcriptional regulator [Steroidobacteraceae bacterium]|nr:TetR/AcrR family transcriptional regulator [Steroidobacteraceae bacterium]